MLQKQIVLFVIFVLIAGMTFSIARGGEFENLGVPVGKAGFMGVTIGPDQTGLKDVVYLRFMQEGAPWFLLAVDPDTGETQQYNAPADGGCWAGVLGPDNKIYVGTTGQALIQCFDPAKPQEGVKTIGRPSDTETYIWQLCVGADGKIYGCTYGNAKLVSYDPKTGKLADLGRMDDTQDYTRTIAAGPNGKIYTAIGAARQDVVVYDPTTQTHRSLIADDWRINGFPSVKQGRDGNVYASLHVPTNTGKKVFKHFRIDDETFIEVPTILEKQYLLRDGGVVGMFVMNASGGSFTVTDPKTDRYRRVHFTYEGAGSSIFIVGVGPENNIYGSTKMPLEVFRHDPRVGRSEHLGNMPGGEVYSMLKHNEKLYLCYYTDAIMNLYDPKQPGWNWGTAAKNNPRSFGSIGDGHLRPRAMIQGPNDMIYVGSYPPYGQLGGAMGVWDPKQNKTIENYRNLIQDQGISALAFDSQSGLIFGGSSIAGGGGTTPTQKEALFFAFDPVTKKKVMETALVPGAKIYQAMFATEGRVFVGVNNRIVVYDTKTMAKVHEAGLYGWQLDAALGQHTDGLLYGLTDAAIFSMDPKTFAVKVLAKAPVKIHCGFALTNTGIYFASGVHLWRYKLSQP